jgi:hypothetical protein
MPRLHITDYSKFRAHAAQAHALRVLFFVFSWFNNKKIPKGGRTTLPRLRIYLLPKPQPDGRSSDFRINLLPAPSRSVL